MPRSRMNADVTILGSSPTHPPRTPRSPLPYWWKMAASVRRLPRPSRAKSSTPIFWATRRRNRQNPYRRASRPPAARLLELPDRSEQTAEDQNCHGKHRQDVPDLALLRVFHIGERVDFPADQVDHTQHRSDERAVVMAEDIERGQKYDQLLQGILLDAKISFEYLVSRDGRRHDSVAPARFRDLETEYHELQKCERSHNVNISHGCSSPVEGF